MSVPYERVLTVPVRVVVVKRTVSGKSFLKEYGGDCYPLQSRGNQKQSSGKIQLKDHIEDLGSKELAERGKEDPRSAKSLFPLTTGMARGET